MHVILRRQSAIQTRVVIIWQWRCCLDSADSSHYTKGLLFTFIFSCGTAVKCSLWYSRVFLKLIAECLFQRGPPNNILYQINQRRLYFFSKNNKKYIYCFFHGKQFYNTNNHYKASCYKTYIKVGGKSMRNPVNIKEASKKAKIYVGRSLTQHIFCFMLIRLHRLSCNSVIHELHSCYARAVPRIFCLRGQTPSAGANSTNLHRDLPYTDRVSSQTLC